MSDFGDLSLVFRSPDQPINGSPDLGGYPSPYPQLGFQRIYIVQSQGHPRLAYLSCPQLPVFRSPDQQITRSQGGTPSRVIPTHPRLAWVSRIGTDWRVVAMVWV